MNNLAGYFDKLSVLPFLIHHAVKQNLFEILLNYLITLLR